MSPSCEKEECGCGGNPRFDGLDPRYKAVLWFVIALNAVIGASLKTRATAALLKGISLSAMGLFVFGSTAYQLLILGLPRSEIMAGVGFLALIANAASVLLMRYKDGDANVRSVWLCSRNDAIGNVAVMLAAAAVFATGSALPDLLVATIMAGLFLSSSLQIISRSRAEFRTVAASRAPVPAGSPRQAFN